MFIGKNGFIWIVTCITVRIQYIDNSQKSWFQVSSFINDNSQPPAPVAPILPNHNEWPGVKRGTLDYRTTTPEMASRINDSTSGPIIDRRSPMTHPSTSTMPIQVQFHFFRTSITPQKNAHQQEIILSWNFNECFHQIENLFSTDKYFLLLFIIFNFPISRSHYSFLK